MPPNMSATVIDFVIFRNIFSTEAMRRVFSDETRVQKYLDYRGGAGARAGAAWNHPAGSRRRDRAATAMSNSSTSRS